VLQKAGAGLELDQEIDVTVAAGPKTRMFRAPWALAIRRISFLLLCSSSRMSIANPNLSRSPL